MVISVCIGSSCHLKGSYDIISLLKHSIKNSGLEEQVSLNASFCLGKCTSGVSIKIDDEIITGVSRENFDQIFDRYVRQPLVSAKS